VEDDPPSIWQGMDDFDIPHNGVCYGASELEKGQAQMGFGTWEYYMENHQA